MIGRTISHYKILEKLGQGGMGVVYKAEDTKLKRTVALKFLSQNLLESERDKSRFVHEAQAAAGLDHTNICTVHEINEADGHTFIVMAYIEGESLKDRLETDAQLDIEQAVDIATQVARGLTRAHKKGIVHRDIKPANIRITPENEVKIVDFGLARAAAQTTLTQEGMTVGTVAYMSPEQAQGNRVDHRSDIFSLGVVLYEMLAGHLPFRGDRNAAIVYGIVNAEPEPLESARDDLPEGLIQIVTKALTKDVDQRYQSAADMVDDLERLVRGDTPRLRTRRKRRLRIAIGAAAVVVLVAVVAALKFAGVGGSDVEDAENKLAVLYFENVAEADDPQRWGRMLQELLISRLSESQNVSVMSSQRLYDLLNRLGKAGLKIIDGATAAEVAVAGGANWILSGSILQSEPYFVVTSQVANVESGDVAASQQITGVPGEEIFAVADRLIREIRSDLAIPSGPDEDEVTSVADVTTHSPEAYRHYVDGMDNLNRGFPAEASRSFQRALDYDSTFAMAYLRLSRLDIIEPAERTRFLEQAARYAANASAKNHLYIMSAHAQSTGSYVEAIKGYESIVESYPEEKEAYLQLGALYQSQEDWEAAIECYQKVVKLDPFDESPHVQLYSVYTTLGENEMALMELDKYEALAPDNPDPYDTRAWFYAYNGRADDAIDSFNEALKRNPDYWLSVIGLAQTQLMKQNYAIARTYGRKLIGSSEPWLRGAGGTFVSLIPLYQGKLGEGLETLDAGIAGDRVAGYEGQHFAYKLFLRSAVHFEKRDRERAVDDLKRFIEVCEKNNLEGLKRWEGVYLYGLADELSKADVILDSYESELDSSGPDRDAWYSLARGYLEMKCGNLDTAREHLVIAKNEFGAGLGSWLPHHFLARVHLEMNQWDDAIHEFEKALSIYGTMRVIFVFEAVKTHYYLGIAYEQNGQAEKAAAQYETFLDIWRNADSGIDELEDAKQRLAALRIDS
jgi:tetratricopeptide (TPR) repeat protein/tRNA A-37 threonylcarbamoyl transferase component Bud32/TolB-like protein